MSGKRIFGKRIFGKRTFGKRISISDRPKTKMPLKIALLLLAGCGVPAVSAPCCHVRQAVSVAELPALVLPDAPVPANAAPAAEARNNQPPAAATTGQNASASPAQNSALSAQLADQTKRQKAQQQLKAEKKQRVLGVVPNFTTSYNWNAVSLTAGQKMQLAFRSTIDPFTFAAAGLVAGVNEALDEDPGFGWGAAGYGKRAGAAYLDAFDGDMFATGILPSLLRQDPRYFRLGHGSFHRRLFYSIAASFICRQDKTGKWEPNYSNVGGNIIAGGISNLYYPSQNSGWGRAVGNGMVVTLEGTAGGVFAEFWPDIDRKLLKRKNKATN